MRLLLVLLAILAALPPALAQLPGPAACGPLAMNLPVAVDVPAGGSRLLVATVENRGGAEGTVTVELAEGPDAWTVTVEPASRTVAPGTIADFNVTIEVPADATAREEVRMGAIIVCGPLPIQRSQTVTTSTTVTPAAPRDSPADQALDLAGRYGVWVLGLALVAGLGTAAVAGARRGRSGLAIGTPEPLKRLRPGRGISFALEVENRGGASDTVHFQIDNVPAGWAAFTALPEMTLAPREKRTMWLMVRAPADAPNGSVATLHVTARSDARPHQSQGATVRAEVREEPEGPAEGESDISP